MEFLIMRYQHHRKQNYIGQTLIKRVMDIIYKINYRNVSNISCTKSQNLNDSRLVLEIVFTQSIEAGYQVENEDVVGAAPTGDAPTTSE